MRIEEILSELIQIESVNPPGGETKVAQYLKRLFDNYNIPNEIIEPSPGRGSFIAHLGTGDKSLLYLAHTDVVGVSEGWSFAPFSGEIRDGFVHGRGALDCKGLVAAEAHAVINLARNNKLKGRLIFAATADEEAGGIHGVKHIVDNYKDKIMADFAINEGGWQTLRVGNNLCQFIQTGEKGVSWMKLNTKGVAAHGSVPMLGDNAVIRMSRVIEELTKYQPRITLIPEVKDLISTIISLEGFDIQINESNIDDVIKKLKDRTLAANLMAITRMTVSPNKIFGGTKINIVPDTCEAEIDIRVLPGQDKNYVTKGLKQAIGDIEMKIVQYQAPTFSSANSEFYPLISRTLQETLNGSRVLPCISSGSTDSKYLREIGIPCYGIGMMTLKLDPSMKQSVHGKDEKVDIPSLQLKSEFLQRLAIKYFES
jgi:acetylornithine deacetylase/succinyl-diaminopimelate desuccinylase-like protein